jgi:hypothetical protein
MTNGELVREIAQPLTDQSDEYNALNQNDARTPAHRRAGCAHSQSPATAGRNGNAPAMNFALPARLCAGSAFGVRCVVASLSSHNYKR